MTFHLNMCINIDFSSVRLLGGQLLGNSCSLGCQYYVHLFILTMGNISYFPFWF